MRRKRNVRHGSEPEASPGRAARPLRRFAVRFALLSAVLLGGLGAVPWMRSALFPRYLAANAAAGAAILDLLGEGATAAGTAVLGSRFQLDVRRGCDALGPSALFTAAVLAFPASARRRGVALAVGVPALLALNLVRLVSLYYVGALLPAAFDTVHLDVWPPLFILATALLWLAWALPAARGGGATR